MTAQFVKACSGDISECSISTSTSYRQRKAGLKVAEERIQDDFKNKALQALMILHWDGKKIKYQKRRQKDDRLAIVASFPRPTDKHQFLGAPRIPDGTGSSMKQALMTILGRWEISHDSILGMSWDTTSSNTGIHQGSATLFEEEMGRALLWLACRHHMGELHIKHADIKARGSWKGMNS